MNKKIIKYLIGIIIIAAVLILITVSQTRATLSQVLQNGSGEIRYNEFRVSENLFCLDHGLPFASVEVFSKISIDDVDFEHYFWEFTGSSVDKDVLDYIVVESVEMGANARQNITRYIPQVAIWKLTGSGLDGLYNSDKINAYKLIAEAQAYNNFINKLELYGKEKLGRTPNRNELNELLEPDVYKNSQNEIIIEYFDVKYGSECETYKRLL